MSELRSRSPNVLYVGDWIDTRHGRGRVARIAPAGLMVRIDGWTPLVHVPWRCP